FVSGWLGWHGERPQTLEAREHKVSSLIHGRPHGRLVRPGNEGPDWRTQNQLLDFAGELLGPILSLGHEGVGNQPGRSRSQVLATDGNDRDVGNRRRTTD